MTYADTSKPIINKIGDIGNYYGGLSVKADNGKYFWSIENYDGENWQEITKALYDALIEFEKPHNEARMDANAKLALRNALRVIANDAEWHVDFVAGRLDQLGFAVVPKEPTEAMIAAALPIATMEVSYEDKKLGDGT